MMDISNLMAQLRHVGPDILQNYCIINGNIWPLEQVEKMGLEEYAARTIFSLPLRFYKYYPDVKKDGTNYSISALESNEVYLSSPSAFDDVFDSEIYVPWEDFEAHRIKTYAQWCKCDLAPNASTEDAANAFLMCIYNAVQNGSTLESAFSTEGQEELVKLQVSLFSKRMLCKMMAVNDWGIALRNVLTEEYNRFSKDLQQMFRVACFTTTPVSQLMWGGYANEHNGFCLEYTVIIDKEYEDVLHNIRPVIYCKTRQSVTQALLESYDHNLSVKALSDIYFNGALRKSIDWAYQNEWRLLLPPQEHGQKGFSKKFFPITKVYLGNRMSKDRREEIIGICKREGIPYVGVIRSPELFEMQECDTLCENCARYNSSQGELPKENHRTINCKR